MIRIYCILLAILTPNVGFSASSEYSLFRDYVQYSSSVDAYSKMCIKNFQPDLAKSELFELINILNNNYFNFGNSHYSKTLISLN